MNTLLIARARNDADIVEAFVRHHAALANLMVVIDQGSRDGTRAILEALRQEGLPLLIVDDPALATPSSARLTEVYRKVAPIFDPELVWLLDVGQFVRGERAALEEELGRLPPGATAVVRRTLYVPDVATAARPTLADPLAMIAERHPNGLAGEWHGVLRRDPADDASLVMDDFDRPLRRGETPLPAFASERVTLACLPVRGSAQLTARLLHDWQVHRARHDGDYGARERFAARTLLDRILAGLTITPEEVVRVARGDAVPDDLVRDPVPHDYATLRYLHLIDPTALKPVLDGRQWPAPLPPAATIATGEALDLAPLLDLCAGMQAERAIVLAPPQWSHAVASAHPALMLHVPRADEPEVAVDLVFVPAMPADLIDDIAPAAHPDQVRRIAYWPAEDRAPGALAAELDRWAASGWEPDLMRTLGYRALSSYGVARHGAIVLAPADAERPERAQAIRAALVAMDQDATRWIDPAPTLILYPLQSVGVARPTPAPLVETPMAVSAAAAPVPAPARPLAPRSVLILGSGRSGTSALAGMFGEPSHHHADDLYAPQVSNPKGFFEAAQINDLNESMLVTSAAAYLGADGARALLQGFEPHQLWLARFPDTMPVTWTDAHRRDIAQAISVAPFVLKDPRMAVTAPAWLEAAPDALVLSIHRSPAVTAESILKECRTATYLLDFRVSMKDAFEVWRQAYRRAVQLYRAGGDVLFLRYGDLFDAGRLSQLERHVRAPVKRDFAEKHLDRTAPTLKVPAECEALHALLETLCELSFAGRRADAEAEIDRYLARWPDRVVTRSGGTTASAAA